MSRTACGGAANLQQTIDDLQRQLAERTAERNEALARETASAAVLAIINSSPGDLAPVFDGMLSQATRLCEATYGHVRIYDGSRFHLAAVRGDPELVALHRQRPAFEPGPHSPITRTVRGERVVHIADAMASDHYRDDPPFRELADSGVCRAMLLVGLRKDDALLGFISVYREEARPFSDKQIELLQNFAVQAVIAMENARLLTETRESLAQQTATAEVLGVINSSPGDLAPVFDAILEKAHSLCGAAKGALVTYDGEYFRAVATRGLSGPSAELLCAPQNNPPGSPPDRMLRGESLIHIPDFRTLEFPIPRTLVEHDNVRTALFTALRKDSVLLGYITAYRLEVLPFSDKQIALLENFAAQAVIAMENARLLTETHEALEQQTATTELLQVINSSPGDLTPVFDAMLEKARRLCGAAQGNLWTYDGERFHPAATHGSPRYAEWVRRRGPFLPEPGSTNERILQGESVVEIPDLVCDPVSKPDNRIRRALIEIGGFRTLLSVALRKEQTLLGVLHFFRQEVRRFSEKEIALVQNFAAQAVIAMENARLLGELRERTADLGESLEYQTATSEVLQVISRSTFDLQPVLDTVAATAARLCEADLALINSRDGDVFRTVATCATSPEYDKLLHSRPFTLDRGSLTGRLALDRTIVHIADITADPDYTHAASVTVGKLRSVLGVPLMREGVVVGTIALGRQRVEPFSKRQIDLLRTFADQAVIAMENARLLGELRQRTEEVAELNRGLEARVAEQVEELGRVGRLKRFLAPQLAELIVSQGDEKILESHRREIVVVFCDLRGYTAFTETAEPEEVLDFLREYHGALGPLVSQFEGTLDQFSGDGIMVFFNDPVPCLDPAERAVKMAMAMREAAGTLIATWRHDGCELGFGAGIAQGYATLGQIGFSERSGYTAIGTVCNLAARLCAEAKDGQILISSRVARAVEAVAMLDDLGNLELRGLRRPVAAFNVVQSTSTAEARPNLIVVARGSGA